MKRGYLLIAAAMLLTGLSSCKKEEPETAVQQMQSISDNEILNMFAVNGKKLSFPCTMDEMLSAGGLTARKLYNIDYPDDVDVTARCMT